MVKIPELAEDGQNWKIYHTKYLEVAATKNLLSIVAGCKLDNGSKDWDHQNRVAWMLLYITLPTLLRHCIWLFENAWKVFWYIAFYFHNCKPIVDPMQRNSRPVQMRTNIIHQQKCWYWVFVHSCGVMWCICSDYFSCFLSRLIRWFVAFVLHCFSVFALFVYLKMSCPESLLFSLWHWAQGLYSVASPHNLVSDTGHKSALLWFILTYWNRDQFTDEWRWHTTIPRTEKLNVREERDKGVDRYI